MPVKDIVCANGLGGDSPESSPRLSVRAMRRRNLVILLFVSFVLLVVDQATKLYFNAFELGQVISGPFLGLIQFRLVHNIGAAWGIFGGATTPLGVFALVICLFLLLYLFVLAPDSSTLSVLGLSMVFAGGIGNAIDRFALGYVVDFLEPVFIEFPVFNVADIGVTCGFALFFIALFFEFVQAGREQFDE